jgi:hypothetical protein
MGRVLSFRTALLRIQEVPLLSFQDPGGALSQFSGLGETGAKPAKNQQSKGQFAAIHVGKYWSVLGISVTLAGAEHCLFRC